MGKYSDNDYVSYDPFDGDRDVDVRCRSVKIVAVRKEHVCHSSLIDKKPHNVKIGERARVEKALVEGEWGSYYVCIPCMDRWLDEMLGGNHA